MRTVFFKLPKTKDYSEFVDGLISADMNHHHREVNCMGKYKSVGRGWSKTYYLFSLINGATVISSINTKGLIGVSTVNIEHTRETKTLLSRLTGIPINRFKLII